MKNVNWYTKQAALFEKSRFGAMTLMMTFLSCYGSIGAMFSIVNHFYLGLILAAMVTLSSNVSFIAQLPSKVCLGFFYVGFITNTIIIIVNLIF